MLMNFASIAFPYLGSGSELRWGACALLDIQIVLDRFFLALGPFRAVLRPALATIADATAVERAADDVIAHAGQVLHAAAADQHDRVLLQVVAFAADVARDLETVREPHAGDLAHRGVRLLRRRRVNAGADAALLRRGAESGHAALGLADHARLTNELVGRRHSMLPNKFWPVAEDFGIRAS